MVQDLLYHVFGGLKVIFENDGLACVGCAGKKKMPCQKHLARSKVVTLTNVSRTK